MSSHAGPAPRRRPPATAAATVALAVLVGLGVGAGAALWSDREVVGAHLPVGGAVFGVGAPAPTGGLSQYASHDGAALTFTFGPDEAHLLHREGAVAVPVQVDSLAQGNLGLTYTVEPSVSGGLFGASTWTLTRVEDAQACTTEVSGGSALTSTPWGTTYTDAAEPTSEYWCLVARWAPLTGTHEDTVTAGGSVDVPGAEHPVPVTGSDTWTATVTERLDPAEEPEHRLTFTFTTVRPATGTTQQEVS